VLPENLFLKKANSATLKVTVIGVLTLMPSGKFRQIYHFGGDALLPQLSEIALNFWLWVIMLYRSSIQQINDTILKNKSQRNFM
jgi:hypothetical protein